MKMYIKSVMVDDQAKALAFYTEKLRFKVKHDIPMGEHRWLTLVSSDDSGDVELALEPNQYPAAKTLQASLMKDGIPWTAFSVDNLETEAERLEAAGVKFAQAPTKAGEVSIAVIDDTCGNLIQLIQLN